MEAGHLSTKCVSINIFYVKPKVIFNKLMSKHWKNNYISKFPVASKSSRFWIISQIDDDTLQNFLLNSFSYYLNNIGGKVQSVSMLLKFQKFYFFKTFRTVQ